MKYGNLVLNEDHIVQDGLLAWKIAHLDQINGATVMHKQFPLFIVLGLVSLAAGAWMFSEGSSEAGGALAAIGAGLLVAFFLTRKTALVVRTASVSMLEIVGGKNRDAAKDFARQVISAISARRAAV